MPAADDHMMLTDAIGNVHAAAEPNARIVCLVPSVTELICDLGLGGQLVGRTGFCIHPWEIVRSIPKVGGTKDVKLDLIRELAPTHAIVNIDENRRETAEALAEFVPNIVVTHPQTPADNLPLYRLLGGIFSRAREAERLCAEFEQALCDLQGAPCPPQEVLYLIWRDPWMSVAPQTYIAQMLALINWRSHPLATPDRYPEVDLATYAGRVDRVLLSSEPYHFRARHVEEVSALLPSARVSLIDGEMTSWYGSRAIKGLRYMATLAAAGNEPDGASAMPNRALAIESPCIGVCEMDEVAGYCRGCMRTLSEIASWTQYSPSERRRIMSRIERRNRTADLSVGRSERKPA